MWSCTDANKHFPRISTLICVGIFIFGIDKRPFVWYFGFAITEPQIKPTKRKEVSPCTLKNASAKSHR